MPFDIADLAVVALCLAAGGLLKGATGVGAPVVAIPVMALVFDVRFAIVVMMLPNLIGNVWQLWNFRAHLGHRLFTALMTCGSVFGVVVGTYALANLPAETLSLLVAGAISGYVALRLTKPDWRLAFGLAQRLAFPAGMAAGFLQGASGISAPVSITFLNAVRFPRPVFIAIISVVFCVFTVFQIAALEMGGVIRDGELWVSAFALIPSLAAMPLGARLARDISPEWFDRVILALLSFIALRLFWINLT